MSRIPTVLPAELDDAQKVIYDRIVSGPRGTIVGPLRVALHSPELADRWEALGEFLRYRTTLSPRISELAIILCGRYWASNLEWIVHSRAARSAGLPEPTIEAIRTGTAPAFDNRIDEAVYVYCCALLEAGDVADATYDDLHRLLGTVALVELTALVGYYTMVAMTVNVHRIPLPNHDEAGELLDDISGGREPFPHQSPTA